MLTDKIKSDTGQDVSQDFSKLDTDGNGSFERRQSLKLAGPQPA